MRCWLIAALAMALPFAALAEMSSSNKPNVIEWQEHYLVLQGENFLPVEKALSTPNATLYQVSDGYVPSTPFTKVDETSACGNANSAGGQSVQNTAVGSMAADVAVAQAGEMENRSPYCLKGLGGVLAGSYVFDGDGNELAGQDFPEPARLLLGSFLLDDDDEKDVKDFLVIPEGGAPRRGDPALEIFSYADAIIVDYPVRRGDVATDGTVQGKGKTYAPPAPDLPVTVTYQVIPGGDPTDVIYAPINPLLAALEDAWPVPASAPEKNGEVLIVTRGLNGNAANELKERLKTIREKIKKVLGPSVKIRTVSFGQEIPVCTDNSDACWSMNRSTIVYHSLR
jgi:hypothetical protein